MSVHRVFCLVFASTLATGCTNGCSESSKPSGDIPLASNSAVAPPLREASGPRERPPRPVRHGGFTGLILRAGREAQLSAEQKTAVTDIQQKLHDEEPPFTALTELQTDLVLQIKEGKLDKEKLQADYAAIDKNLLARDEKQADAINALHAALDAPARTALTTAARTRLNAMFRARPELAEAGVGEGGEPTWVKHRLNRVKVELGLDEAQLPKVSALLAKTGVGPAATEALKEQIRKHADDMLTAFDKDEFDAHKLDLSPTGGKAPVRGTLEREVSLIGQLLPILTPEQREKLATVRQRRVLGHWTEDTAPWSPFDEAMETPGGPH
jgi:Spy/CpxP family protein refolding chaperone